MTKIAILGDIHFGKLARSKEFCPDGIKLQDITIGAASIKQGIVDIIKKEQVEYLFIAGDITSTGSPLEYTECYKVIIDIATKANILEEKIIACLGNHDVDWRISDIAENYSDLEGESPIEQNKKFYQKISASIPDLFFEKNNFSIKGPAPFSGIIDNGDLIIFVLNSGWQSSRNEKLPHGKIKNDQLLWFADKAASYKDNSGWKVLLLHHHPIIYPFPQTFYDTSFLEEGSEVVQIAGECGFNIICHGHRHHPKAINSENNDWLNPITFICSGSCSVNATHRNNGDIPNCFHIIELFSEKKIVRLKNFEYSSSKGWKPLLSNRPEAPLDNDMFFYKNYSAQDREKVIHSIIDAKLKSKGCILPEWKELPIELKTLDYKRLNELIVSVYGSKYLVVGRYPDQIALVGE